MNKVWTLAILHCTFKPLPQNQGFILRPIDYRAVDRHNMMERTGFRVEELKFRTFVFQFLALMDTMDYGQVV